jgi:hypothetical protein
MINGGLWEQGTSLRWDSVMGTWREGSFTGDPERYVKDLEWVPVSVKAPCLGNMEKYSFVRAFEIKRYIKRNVKMPCIQVSLSIGAPLGNLEGIHLPGLFERKG